MRNYSEAPSDKEIILSRFLYFPRKFAERFCCTVVLQWLNAVVYFNIFSYIDQDVDECCCFCMENNLCTLTSVMDSILTQMSLQHEFCYGFWRVLLWHFELC